MGETERRALAAARSGSDQPLFADGFRTGLLEAGTFRQVTLRAVPEGHIIHAHTPTILTTTVTPAEATNRGSSPFR